MAKFQIQSQSTRNTEWIDEPTCAYSRRHYDTAIAAAKVIVSEAQVFGKRKRVRIVRSRWFSGTDIVWEASDC